MYVIVGLGNPGKKYENTKHNIGFITIDQLAEKYGISVKQLKHKALIGEGQIEGHRVLLVKPQTYMNLSGESLRYLLRYREVPHENLLVIYDDVDLPMGNLRLRKKGSAGTHNGMRSVIYQLQYDDFPRLRIGIGSEKKEDMLHYVVSGFCGEDRKKVEFAVEQAVKAIGCWLSCGIESAMGEYNTKKKETKREKKQKENAESSEGTESGSGKTAAGEEKRTTAEVPGEEEHRLSEEG